MNPSDKSEQALRGIKEIKNSYATIINASDKSEQALRAIKTLNFLVKVYVLNICKSIINLHISWTNLNH